MNVDIVFGNILDAQANALCLTVDGCAPGMEGNLARQFAGRWPELWEELSENVGGAGPEVPGEPDPLPGRVRAQHSSARGDYAGPAGQARWRATGHRGENGDRTSVGDECGQRLRRVF